MEICWKQYEIATVNSLHKIAMTSLENLPLHLHMGSLRDFLDSAGWINSQYTKSGESFADIYSLRYNLTEMWLKNFKAAVRVW